MTRLFCLLALPVCLLVAQTGCDNTASETGKPVVPAGGENADHHDDHGHGPKGGYAFAFETVKVNGEWFPRYNDHLVIFYIYGEDKKTETPAKITRLAASRKVGDKVEEFEIKPVNEKDGMASRFEIVDENFAIAMKTTGVTLEIESDGQKDSIVLAKDAHH